ncbi:hypothetical protein [Acinetobacter sp. MD2(2019)]|uniref:hypothetical protein n=1 Tax=Acinetobacter sp. MD2(2019) TaxID=2605273 RepID=UPI003B631EAA
MRRIYHAILGGVLTLLATASFASGSQSVEYNIANGFSPAAKGQSISVLMPYQGEFRILASKTYTHDEQAKFSPIDYAVSWGMFANPKIAREIDVRQYDRFLNWKMKTLPVPPHQAVQMVSNMHIIPANPQIAKQIQQVKRGDLVRLRGDLVEVKDNDLVWRSALNNYNIGDGACKLFRVNSIQWVDRTDL